MDEVDAPKIQRRPDGAHQPRRAVRSRSFPGKVRRVAPYVSAVEKQARTVDIEVDFRPAGSDRQAAGRLQRRRRGDPRRARQRAARADRGACRKAAACWCAGADGKLEARTLKTGLANWEYTEVLERAGAGDRVVTSLEREGVKRRRRRVAAEDEAEAMSAAQIELSGIERVFQVGDSEVHALRSLNLAIAAGEYVAVMGPSGSGKSTLLNLLGLLDRPDAGLYRLEGRDVTDAVDRRAGARAPRADRLRVPDLSPGAAPDGGRKHRAADDCWPASPPASARTRVAKALQDFGLDDRARPPAGPALRRPAPARGHRARDHHAAGGDPRRRADRQPRPRHRRGGHAPARRAERARRHADRRHARPRHRRARAGASC